MNLVTKTRFPLLTAVVNTPVVEDADPADNDTAFALTGATGTELLTLLDEGLVASDGGRKADGGRTFLLFNGNLRLRLGGRNQITITARDTALSNQTGSYMKDVSGTEAGPWWKALRDAVRKALAAEAEAQAADDTVLGNTWDTDNTVG